MYPIENSSDLIKNKRKNLFSRTVWASVGSNVFFLGLTSLLTDISSEMVTATLPLYILLSLRLAPLQFGLIDGINQGASVLVRIASGLIADRSRRAKEVATAGYAFSAVCRIGLLLVGRSWLALSGVVLLDRIGKGIRTSPRDAMIAASIPSEKLATAFGVHRAMDTAGAMLGPLLAAGLLALTPGSFDSIFIVSFCFAIVGVAVIGLLVESPAPAARTPAAGAAPISAQLVTQLLARPDFRVLVLISSALSLTTLSDSFIFLTLQRKLDFNLSLFPLLYVGMALVYMVLAIPMGKLADRLGRQQIFLAGYVFLAGAYGLLLLPGLPQMLGLGILLLLGLYYAATDGVLAALASAILPEQWRTTGLAIMSTGVGLARLFASLAYGALWTYIGPNQALAIFIVGLMITMLLALLFLKRVERSADGLSHYRERHLKIFAWIALACAVVAVGYIYWAIQREQAKAALAQTEADEMLPLVAKPDELQAIQAQPHLLYINEKEPSVGQVGLVGLEPGSQLMARTALSCGRVHYAAGNGICLTYVTADNLDSYILVTLFGSDFKPRHELKFEGILSRARISPDGRYAAFTILVSGHSYTDINLSTATVLLNTASGVSLGNLEEFETWKDGRPYDAPDFNFWGVTFAQDSNQFYATLKSSDKTYLVQGDIAARKLTILHENVECPSLSPDGTRIAFKKLTPAGLWRLTVLNLATMQETPLAEQESIDDQVEWLDNERILYQNADYAPLRRLNVFVLPADGSGKPEVFIPNATSPVVVR